MIAWRMRVQGRVQGVWFRASTQKAAWEFGVNGWVRNTEEGDVEVHAEGDQESLEHFFVWLHQGPPLAQVSSVEKAVVPVEGFSEFHINY